MKEFDYTKWDNNPREMWVWDIESEKQKKFVVFINNYTCSPSKVLVVSENVESLTWWRHCAEIEQTRRMTNYELAHWLWEGIQVGEFREYSYAGENKKQMCTTRYYYFYEDEELMIDKEIKIRVNGGEWKEPLVEE